MIGDACASNRIGHPHCHHVAAPFRSILKLATKYRIGNGAPCRLAAAVVAARANIFERLANGIVCTFFRVISRERIDYHYYDQLGTRIVGGPTGSAPGGEAHQQPGRNRTNRRCLHFAVVYR